MGQEIVSTGQAAKLCSVTPDTILKWIKNNRVEAVKTAGGHYRITKEKLKPYMVESLEPDPTDIKPIKIYFGKKNNDPEIPTIPLKEFNSEITKTINDFQKIEHEYTIEDIWSSLKEKKMVDECNEELKFYEVFL